MEELAQIYPTSTQDIHTSIMNNLPSINQTFDDNHNNFDELDEDNDQIMISLPPLNLTFDDNHNNFDQMDDDNDHNITAQQEQSDDNHNNKHDTDSFVETDEYPERDDDKFSSPAETHDEAVTTDNVENNSEHSEFVVNDNDDDTDSADNLDNIPMKRHFTRSTARRAT